MKAEYINPFLMSAKTILEQVANIQTTLGKIYVRNDAFANDVLLILIGVTGNIVGRITMALKTEDALHIAGAMCGGVHIEKFDEFTQSAISELANMISGNAMTLFSTHDILCDITPPTVCYGAIRMQGSGAESICIPLQFDGSRTMEIEVSIKENS